ncbi:acyl-CoA dehydrogenase [Bordetella trematum]|uniref:3-sulfinopropanoyl-CoA desulfinase n=1 Tax=Bordetella trematum TaxID=123899 RepID=A0A157Q1N0_9BORD|nr:3-sulfinopropanoyl-CoA desulfinase [Bordetella trematum]AZR93805.1 acyl-CoA dehydrogenase [Bordetella trematum]NNH18924.1 acyl-CoA dehydrogenase [Bordetella trematum]SAI39490.1 acyl-CoA dehydrogenase [Bordetella trematum]SAI71910.1 acyl-CoA dehydrogenase [Bordetella trematum]SUV98061.1 acyl-CoA dehydrogenase [Bordetella trematum]
MTHLTKEQLALQARARELAQSEFAPTAAETDRTEAYPWDNIAKLRDAGFMGMTLPKSSGGQGLSYLDTVIVIEEMAKACATMGRITVEANMGAIGAIARYGSAEQLALAADLVLNGDKPAICISEPNAGSAASEMTTRAVKQGDHYILNGEKYWITGGGVSRLHLIFARVIEDGVDQGIGAFIAVREDAGTEGLVVGRRLYAMGVRGIPETHLEFHDLKVHKSMMVVPPGGLKRGFAGLMNAYNAQRVGAGTVALGIAQGAFEEGLAYLKDRKQFGRPIAEFQGLQWMLADMSTQLEAARLLLHYAASSGTEFPDIDKAARAKIFAAETANKVTNDALQFYGSSGYGRHNPMERHVRDARMFTIAGGTAQILRTQVAGSLLGMKLPQTRDGFTKLAEKA